MIVGLGDHGRELLREALQPSSNEPSHPWVVGVDLQEEAPGSGEARSGKNALFVQGNAEDSAALQRAAAERAGRVIILAGSDETNVRIAAAVARHASERGGKPQIIAGISSSIVLDGVRERLAAVVHPGGTASLRFVSFRAVALRAILRELAERFLRVTQGQRSIRVLVAAQPALTVDFLKSAIPFLQISGERKPVFVVCGSPQAQQSFERHHPESERVAEIRWLDIPPGEAGLSRDQEGQLFDVAIVEQEGTVAALHAAELCLNSHWFRVEHVHVLLRQEPDLEFLPDPRLSVSSIFKLGRQCEEFGQSDSLESEARENHDAYLNALKPEDRARQREWDTLEEFKKESNRWAVLSRRVKRSVWECTPEAERAATLERLSISEHSRWMAEKVMAGWRLGCGADGKQDASRRLHPDLLPWTELSEEIREKDRVQVRKALGI